MATATMTAVLRNASNAPALSTAMLLVQIISIRIATRVSVPVKREHDQLSGSGNLGPWALLRSDLVRVWF